MRLLQHNDGAGHVQLQEPPFLVCISHIECKIQKNGLHSFFMADRFTPLSVICTIPALFPLPTTMGRQRILLPPDTHKQFYM